MIRAGECICGKAHERRMFVEEGTCLWCGHGICPTPQSRSILRRLPRDLGAFQREGRRPDPAYDNVVRLDRLPRAFSTMREAA